MPLCWHIFFVIFEFPALIHGVYTEWITLSIKGMKAFISALANFIVFEHRAAEAAEIVGNSTTH